MRATPPVLAERVDVRERFDAKVSKPSVGEGCWFWTGGISDTGYGQFAVTSNEIYSCHRLVIAAELGRSLAHPEWALHRCDERSCVNPDHIRIGDARANKLDAIQRGRYAGPGIAADIRGPAGRARELARTLRAAGQQHIYDPALAAEVLAAGEPLRLFTPPPTAYQDRREAAAVSQAAGTHTSEVATR